MNERAIYLRFTFVPNTTDVSNEGLNFVCESSENVRRMMSHSLSTQYGVNRIAMNIWIEWSNV